VLSDFRKFVLRGNVVDLAVAVVIGAAFTALVNSLVKNLFTPIVAAIFGEPDFANLTFTINGSVFRYGAFINELITFLSVAAAMFFFVVRPLSHLLDRLGWLPREDPTRECPECLSDIPAAARRCANCTATVTPAAEPAT
jgi:large conductance mechanosensitive channel